MKNIYKNIIFGLLNLSKVTNVIFIKLTHFVINTSIVSFNVITSLFKIKSNIPLLKFDKKNKEEEKDFFNEKGEANKSLIFSSIFTFGLIIYISVFSLSILFQTFLGGIELNFETFLKVIFEMTAKPIEFPTEHLISLSVLLSILYSVILIFKNEKNKYTILVKSGLNKQFKILDYQKKCNIFHIQSKEGEILNDAEDQIKRKIVDLKNILQVENIIVESTKETGKYKIITFTGFPTVDLMKELKPNQKDYLREGKIFLGITNKPLPKEGIPSITLEPINIKGYNFFAVYLDIKALKIHMIMIGASGKGKSNNLASIAQSYFMNFDSIDMFIMHDFKGIENLRFERLKQQNPHFKDRIHTSQTMEQLYYLLIKIHSIYEYRKAKMAEMGETNWTGSSIIFKIDEYNSGFEALNSKDPAVSKIAQEAERMIVNGEFIYRAMGIYFDILGQSHLENKNMNTSIRDQSGIQFFLGVSPTVAGKCDIAVENGIKLELFEQGRTLYTNKENNTFIEFLPLFVPMNYLDDFINFVPKPRQQIDLDLNDYLYNLEDRIVDNYKQLLTKGQRVTKMTDDELEERFKMYKEDVKKSFEEMEQGIYVIQEETKNLTRNKDYKRKTEVIDVPSENTMTDEEKNQFTKRSEYTPLTKEDFGIEEEEIEEKNILDPKKMNSFLNKLTQEEEEEKEENILDSKKMDSLIRKLIKEQDEKRIAELDQTKGYEEIFKELKENESNEEIKLYTDEEIAAELTQTEDDKEMDEDLFDFLLGEEYK